MYGSVRRMSVGRAATAVRRYRVAEARRGRLEEVLAIHWRVLHVAELVTDEPPMVYRREGEVVEVFTWRTADAPTRAAQMPAVVQVWRELEARCEAIEAELFEVVPWPLPLPKKETRQ